MACPEGPAPQARPAPPLPPSDADLLRAHVEGGDPHAFSTLVVRHQDRLWAVALRVTGSPEEAADALQDAYVSAFRRAGTSGETRPSRPARAGLLAAKSRRDPVEEREQHDAVVKALCTLNPDQRAALVLGCAPGTVKSRCVRGPRAAGADRGPGGHAVAAHRGIAGRSASVPVQHETGPT